MSPLIYSLLVFTMCIQIAREHVILASMFVLASFLCSSGRMFIVQRQQDCTEGELRQREAQYRRLIENIPEIVWTADEYGNPVLISEENHQRFRLHAGGDSPRRRAALVRASTP